MEGKIDIQDLISKDFFIILKPEFLKKLKADIKKNKTYPQLIKELNIPKRILERGLNGKSAMRMDNLNILIKNSKFAWDDVKENVKELRGTVGGKIHNPEFPLDFTTKAGVRTIAALFGDGCLDKKYRTFYANSTPELVKGFIQDIKIVFGDSVQYIVRLKSDNKEVQIVTLAPMYGRILSKVGLVPGRKVENNPEIPEFIFNLDKEKIATFLSQIIDDEGNINPHSRHIGINFAVAESEKESKIVRGIEKMFKKLGILTSIYKQKVYVHRSRENRRRWQMEIHGLLQFKVLYPILSLRHKEKRKKFKNLINSIKINQYLKRNATEVHLNYMKQIEEEKGYFTSFDVAKASNRAVGSCRNILNKFIKLGLIKKIQPYYGGNLRTPARYVVKNAGYRRLTYSQQVR